MNILNISIIKNIKNFLNSQNLQWVDYFIYAFTSPRMLYKTIADTSTECLGLSFSAPILVCFCDVIALAVLGLNGNFFTSFISYAVMLSIIISLFSNLISAGIMDLLSQMMGYNGKAKSTFILINFSFLPKTLILPVTCIFSISGIAPIFFYFLFLIIFSVWTAVNIICGISEMRSISEGKAALVYFSPLIICMSVAFFTMLIFFIGLFKSLGM
jgi:hypothetical protein